MPVAVEDVTGQIDGIVTSTVVANVPGGTNQLYVAFVSLFTSGGTKGTSEVASMSGGGLTWALVSGTVGGGSRITQTRTEVWWAYGSPSTFSLTVTYNNATLVGGSHVAVARVSGADTTAPINGAYGNSNGTNGAFTGGTDSVNPAITATITNTDSLILNQLHARHRPLSSSDSDYTSRYAVTNISGGNGTNTHVYTRPSPGAGTDAIAHVLTSVADWVMTAVEVKIAAAGGAIFPPNSLSLSGAGR